MVEINIVDSVMGSGKTSAMINYINQRGALTNFIFVTPYLDEIDRVRRRCKKHGFTSPREYPSKLINLKTMLREKQSVAITHALFLTFDVEVMELIKQGKYVLIMDEAIDPMRRFRKQICSYDKKNLIKDGIIKKNKDGSYIWNNDSSEAFTKLYKNIFTKSNIYFCGDSVISFYPIDYFKAFKRIFILTYLFEAQPLRAYFDLHGLKYSYLGITKINKKFMISDVANKEEGGKRFSKLIHVSENKNINEIGNDLYALSRTWYDHCSEEDLEKLKKNCITYFTKNTKTQSKDNMWTTFAGYRKKVKGGGYAQGFLPSNAKAVNGFGSRTAAAYLINKYYQEDMRVFFEEHGIYLDNDLYATSELVQWIFRGAVRNGKEMWVYIPSKRMRDLLMDWLDA